MNILVECKPRVEGLPTHAQQALLLRWAARLLPLYFPWRQAWCPDFYKYYVEGDVSAIDYARACLASGQSRPDPSLTYLHVEDAGDGGVAALRLRKKSADTDRGIYSDLAAVSFSAHCAVWALLSPELAFKEAIQFEWMIARAGVEAISSQQLYDTLARQMHADIILANEIGESLSAEARSDSFLIQMPALWPNGIPPIWRETVDRVAKLEPLEHDWTEPL